MTCTWQKASEAIFKIRYKEFYCEKHNEEGLAHCKKIMKWLMDLEVLEVLLLKDQMGGAWLW